MSDTIIQRLYEQGLLKAIDVHFARLMQRLDGRADEHIALAAALVSRARREGHICLDRARIDEFFQRTETPVENGWTLPDVEAWSEALHSSPVVGEAGEEKPLILDFKKRLYLFRYWEYQNELARSHKLRLADEPADLDKVFLKEGLKRYFHDGEMEEIDWQKAAGWTCLRKKLSIISGGPGTGKTFTVAKILALLIEQAREKPLRIALAAPTGKGAARLQETIRQVKGGLPCSEYVRQCIPDEAKTVHRLLKPIADSPYFHYNKQNPLPLDVLVLDEASMVDLALMSKLAQAMPLSGRMIILGDKDQLASVEAGSVFGDLCDTGAVHAYSETYCRDLEETTGYRLERGKEESSSEGLQDALVQLTKNYRFGKTSGIFVLSRLINEGRADEVMAFLEKGDREDVVWQSLPHSQALLQALKKTAGERFRECLQSDGPLKFFGLFEKFRMLCGLRGGPYGVLAFNRLMEKALVEEGLIHSREKWYPGRPILITRNDYALELFNGDSGVAMRDPETGNDLRVFFQTTQGVLKKYHPLRLPEHETLYAMTVHKSQGSEFDEVLLVLPDREAPVLTRELIYTAVTRARRKVTIWSPKAVLHAAVLRRTQRMSGLRDELWG